MVTKEEMEKLMEIKIFGNTRKKTTNGILANRNKREMETES